MRRGSIHPTVPPKSRVHPRRDEALEPVDAYLSPDENTKIETDFTASSTGAAVYKSSRQMLGRFVILVSRTSRAPFAGADTPGQTKCART